MTSSAVTSPIRAAIWLRVSTGGQSTAKDLAALLDFARRLQVEVVRTYDVTGSAWKGDHRAALDQMMEDARSGLFQVLICADLTRLSREGGMETLDVLKKLLAAGVQLRSLGDPELSGPLDFGRRIVTFVKGELAHEQSNWKSLAVKRGLAKARAEGKHIGRPPGSRDDEDVRRNRESYRREQARRRYLGLPPYNPRPKRVEGQKPSADVADPAPPFPPNN